MTKACLSRRDIAEYEGKTWRKYDIQILKSAGNARSGWQKILIPFRGSAPCAMPQNSIRGMVVISRSRLVPISNILPGWAAYRCFWWTRPEGQDRIQDPNWMKCYIIRVANQDAHWPQARRPRVINHMFSIFSLLPLISAENDLYSLELLYILKNSKFLKFPSLNNLTLTPRPPNYNFLHPPSSADPQ